jgi:hypothetical protein
MRSAATSAIHAKINSIGADPIESAKSNLFDTSSWGEFCAVTLTLKQGYQTDSGGWIKIDHYRYREAFRHFTIPPQQSSVRICVPSSRDNDSPFDRFFRQLNCDRSSIIVSQSSPTEKRFLFDRIEYRFDLSKRQAHTDHRHYVTPRHDLHCFDQLRAR